MRKMYGFTLIELMVVMAILAILLAIGAGAFTSSLKKGRDSTRKANLRSISNALEMYFNDYGRYPAGSSGLIVGCGGGGPIPTVAPTNCNATGSFEDYNKTLYMQQIPADPVSSQKYYYIAPPAGTYFQIYAHLENNQDPAIDQDIIDKSINCADIGTIICNYGISSGNTTP